MAKDVAARLLEMKEEIQEAKLQKASLEGTIKQNLATLKDNFKVSTVEAARTKLAKLKEQKEELTEDLETAVEKLEGAFA